MRVSDTANRVSDNSAPIANERIRERTDARIAEQLQPGGSSVGERIRALRREWDVERVIETEAPLAILTGIALGALLDRRLTAVSGLAAAMLLLHNLQGWYPLLPVLRRAGTRTEREIAEELYALKQHRGDFDELKGLRDPGQMARAAYRCAALS